MPFKVHLLIVSVIIIVVYLGWLLLGQRTVTPPTSQVTEPKQVITVAHANWGLNCIRAGSTTGNTPTADSDAYVNKEAKNNLVEDNVLAKVAKLCDGKEKCNITIDIMTLGSDPASDCNPKNFAVEYRCFSYDRPRTASSMGKDVALDCNLKEDH